MSQPYVNGNIYYGHAPCDWCNSSDAMAVYDTKVQCYSCKRVRIYDGSTATLEHYKEKLLDKDRKPNKVGEGSEILFGEEARAGEPMRKLSKDTLDVYGVTLGYNTKGQITHHYYPYTRDGKTVGTKVRKCVDKKFYGSGESRDTELFGQSLFPKGGKFLTIVEGEIDAMSGYELFKGQACVSVRSASSAVADCKRNLAYINSFDTIVLAFDNDDSKTTNVGLEAAHKVAKLFKPGKVKIMNFSTFPYKDANEFLKAGAYNEWNKCFWKAETFSVKGIIAGTDTWEMVSATQDYNSIPYPWDGLNEKTYGLRTHEMVTLTAGTGMGKTTILKFLSVHLAEAADDDANIGMIMLEESTRETTLGLMSAKVGIPFHLPDATYTKEELKEAFDATLGSNKFFIHENEHFDSSTIQGVLDQVRTMAVAYDCKYVILDHVSIVVSDQQQGDERKALDQLATELKRLTMELGICIIIVCHLRRVSGRPAEEGGQVTLGDLRGTAGIGQLSNMVLALERNSQADDPIEAKTTRIRVLKNRFCGRTGVASELIFDDKKFKFIELDDEMQEKVEETREQYTQEG